MRIDIKISHAYIVHMSQSMKVIEKFGGVRKLAGLLNHTNVTTVDGWRRSGWIHPKHHKTLIALADQEGVELIDSDFVDKDDDK